MINKDHRLLIVDDDPDILLAARLLLKRQLHEVVTCDKPQRLAALLSEQSFDLILLDMNFSPGASDGAQGFELLAQIKATDPDIVVVVITAHGGVEMAVEAMKLGATDFVAKPWLNEKLLATLSSASALRASLLEMRQLKASNQALSTLEARPMLGESEAMQAVMSVVERAAPTDANVLVLGENGTGKELLAREIHQRSLRADKVFMAVDLGAVSESLFESELFGHKKGAFTGANDNRIGRLQAANGGTLFLDEIGNIPLALQAKLLTVLEQRQVTPLGENKALSLDIRVIAATNMTQDKLQDAAYFRQDLLFRLNTVEVTLPPLRARVADIAVIADYYALYYARKYRKADRSLSQAALEAAKAYSWPGNVRALRHAIERSVIMADGDEIEVQDLQISESSTTPIAPPPASAVTVLDDLNLERMERRLVESALKKHCYNISHTAGELGLTRAALYRRMKKYDL